MTTPGELANIVAGALEGTADGLVVARWEGPVDQLATPAVVVSPADPWLESFRLGACTRATWSVVLVMGRWDAPASLKLAEAGYRAAVPLLAALEDHHGTGALAAPYPEDVGGVPTLVARFAVTVTP